MIILESYTFIPRLKRRDLEPSTWGKQSKQQSGPGHWSCIWSFTQQTLWHSWLKWVLLHLHTESPEVTFKADSEPAGLGWSSDSAFLTAPRRCQWWHIWRVRTYSEDVCWFTSGSVLWGPQCAGQLRQRWLSSCCVVGRRRWSALSHMIGFLSAKCHDGGDHRPGVRPG